MKFSMDERRKHERHERRVSVLLQAGDSFLPVELINISASGAQVLYPEDLPYDPIRSMSIAGYGDGYACEVKWKEDDRIGIEFELIQTDLVEALLKCKRFRKGMAAA